MTKRKVCSNLTYNDSIEKERLGKLFCLFFFFLVFLLSQLGMEEERIS
uniref:Trafficking protein particle complex subunit 8 n=1 Tax=Rhizophora mucronata TaxID=61149 RepID=A0A2P2ML42_RHIMU